MMSRKFTLLLSSIFALGAASAPVQAEQLYRWESPDGTVSFTDDAKRVPERYRDTAEQIDTNALSGYGRYTPTDAAATDAYTKRLNERLEMLRDANEMGERAERDVADRERIAPAPAPTRIATQTRRIERRRPVLQPDGSFRWRYSTETPEFTSTPSLPVDPNDPTPVVTEQRRVRVPGQPITQTVTVTRQGDRVLSVVVPDSNYHTLDFGNLSDLEQN
jgi:hypothetical protein